MKLIRYGRPDDEKPGLSMKMARSATCPRLSDDIAGEVLTEPGLARLRALVPSALPRVGGAPRYGAPWVGSESSSASASISPTTRRNLVWRCRNSPSYS